MSMADRLNLTFCRDHIEEIISETTNSRMNPREILQFVFSREISRREENRIRIGIMSLANALLRSLTSRCSLVSIRLSSENLKRCPGLAVALIFSFLDLQE